MTEQGNLFATPSRLRKLSIHIEPRYEDGEGVLHLMFFSSPTKGTDGEWVAGTMLQGEYCWEAASTIVQHQVIRSGGALWRPKPRFMTYQQALDHIGIQE